MMFLFAGHSAGLLSKNFVKQSFTKFLESQLHGSRRKSYLSVPFFFHLRCEGLVRGRLYLPSQRYGLHHKICNLHYGTHGYGMSVYIGFGRRFHFDEKFNAGSISSQKSQCRSMCWSKMKNM